MGQILAHRATKVEDCRHESCGIDAFVSSHAAPMTAEARRDVHGYASSVTPEVHRFSIAGALRQGPASRRRTIIPPLPHGERR
jgi:hypothetical protein